MLVVRLFPRLVVEQDGRAVGLPASRRSRELLAWLACHPGEHSRAALAARFHPDVMDSSARASLRTALHELRRALGDGASCLVADRDWVELAGEGSSVDARTLEDLIAEGRLEEAVELAGDGRILEGLDVDWVYAARDAHRERLGAVNEELARRAEQAGDLEGAVAWSREQVRLEPLSEQATRRLVRRLAACGDRPAALAAYRRLEERMRRDLRVAPSADTRELARSLRTPEPEREAARQTSALRLPAVLRRGERSAFVGRQAVIVALLALVERARRGEHLTGLVVGEPGIGKTRTLAEVCRRAHAQGATVMWGRCYEQAVAPYQPFVEAISEYREAGGELPAGSESRELGRLVPALSDARPPHAAADNPASARYRLFESVRVLLGLAARRLPLIVAIDDLHWADEPTLLLLAHLVRAAEPGGVLILGTYRDNELEPKHPLAGVLADLRGESLIERVVLTGLERDEAAELIAAFKSAAATPAMVSKLLAQTGGNPFFLEELVRHLAESGQAGDVPQGVREVLGRRLARLGGDCNRVLAAAAVVGREFDLELLERLADLEGTDPLSAAEEALSAQLLREEHAWRPGRYTFVHPLVRETLYASLSLARRARLHGQVAAAIELRYADDPDTHLAELAAHRLAAGGDPAEAVDLALRAAAGCLAQLAYEEAASICLSALAILGTADPARRCEILLLLGDARLRSGDPAAREAFAEAAAEARRLGDSTLLARAALGRSGLDVTIIGVDEEAVAMLDECLVAPPGDSALRARLEARLAIETYYASTPAERMQRGDSAVEIARAANDPAALLGALNARRVALWSPGFLSERLETAREMIRVAETTGDSEAVLQARNWLIADLAEQGDLDAMQREVGAHEALANRLRLPSYQWWAPMWRSGLAILEGRFAEAEGLIEEFEALGRRTNDANAALHADLQRLSIRAIQERWAEIDDEPLRRETGRPAEFAWRTTFALIFAQTGNLQAARESLAWVAENDFARFRVDMNTLSCLAELAYTLDLLDERELALPVYEMLLPFADRNVVYGRAASSYGSAAHHLGVLATLIGRTDAARTHFEDALAKNEAMNAYAHTPATQLAYATLLLSTGERASAAVLAARAATLASEIGIAPLAKRARALTNEL